MPLAVHGASDFGWIGESPAQGVDPADCLAVHRYFPLHDGDYGEFMLPGLPMPGDVISTTVDGRPALLARGFAQGGFGDGCYYAFDGGELLLLGLELDGSTLAFSPPLVELDSQLVLSGGTRTSTASGTYEGTSLTISYTITVQEAGTVTVEAGTFANCRRVNVIAKSAAQGQKSTTDRMSYILAPGVGKIRVLLPAVSSAWMEMVEGRVNGEWVGNLESQSLVRSPRFTTHPSRLQATRGLAATFSVVVDGNPPLTYQWMKDGLNLTDNEHVSGANTSSLVIHQVEPEDAGQYSVNVFNEAGCADSAGVALTVSPDTIRPTLKIFTPLANAGLSNALVTIHGEAADNVHVTRVRYHLNDGEWAEATGTTNWMAVVELRPGTNLFSATAVDPSGNESLTASRTLVYVLTSPLRLTINGNGIIGPFRDGQLLEIGRSYTLTATPGLGNLFSNWVGGVTSTNPTLRFTMSSNLVIAANFVPNPFLALKGSYTGLFYDTNAPSHVNAGLFTLTVAEKGAFSGKLQQGAAKYSFSGQFDLALAAQKTVLRKRTNEIVVSLQLTGGSDRLIGVVSNAAWSSELFGYRADFNDKSNPATNFQGGYTLLLPGTDNSADGPSGHGFAQLAVNSGGSVGFKGTLADGNAAVQKVPLAANGQWPLYVGLYSGKGSVFGWLTLFNTPTNDVIGPVLWTKSGGVKGPLHPAGFTNEMEALGSRYVVPASGTRVLDLTNAVVVLQDGNLSASLTNAVILSEQNKVTVEAPNLQKLSLSLAVSSGSISGSFAHPQTRHRSTIKGVLLQKQDLGAGLFPGTNRSGCVFLGLP